MKQLLERAASQTDRRAADNMAADEQARIGAAAQRKARSEGAAETEAALESDRTGRPVYWRRRIRRADGTSYTTTERVDSGSYPAWRLAALCNEAAALAGSRFKRADLRDLGAKLALAVCQNGPTIGRMPRPGELGPGGEKIADPIERDRAYLIGIARHYLADQARAKAAETESLNAAHEAQGDSLSMSELTEQAEAQAHEDKGLTDPDAHPVNRDSWGLSLRFPTRNGGRAALAALIGTRATGADLARQAGMTAGSWRTESRRGRPDLAALRLPVSQWADRDWRTAEALADLIAAETADRRPSLADHLARREDIYAAPKIEWAWREHPDQESPTSADRAFRPTRAARVVAWIDWAADRANLADRPEPADLPRPPKRRTRADQGRAGGTAPLADLAALTAAQRADRNRPPSPEEERANATRAARKRTDRSERNYWRERRAETIRRRRNRRAD